jgi:hypothetical protein
MKINANSRHYTTWPPGQAWASYGPLTQVLTNPPPHFGRFGNYPGALSDDSLALTASGLQPDNTATVISWAVFAGIIGATGWVGWQLWRGK